MESARKIQPEKARAGRILQESQPLKQRNDFKQPTTSFSYFDFEKSRFLYNLLFQQTNQSNLRYFPEAAIFVYAVNFMADTDIMYDY